MLAVAVVTIFLFGLLIVAHEWGHFIVGKKTGIKIHEFSIGLGPALFKIKKGETLYTLRIFLFGGYNRMAGMEPGDLDDPRGFNKKTVGQRMAVISAGSLMNFLLAAFLYFLIFALVGIPTNTAVVGKVLPGKPAAVSGLRSGDKILAVNGEEVESWSELVGTIQSLPGQEVVLTMEREGKVQEVKLIPEADPHTGKGLIGIEQAWEKMRVGKALWEGLKQVGILIWLLLVTLGQIVTGGVPAEVTGPVGIIGLIGQAAQLGMVSLLSFTAFLSLNLGLINLLPVPALDGSRLVFLAVEGIRGKPVDPEKESLVHFIGFALLLALMVLITYKDVLRLLS